MSSNKYTIDTSNTLSIGRLLKPFGVSGFMKFFSYSGEVAHLPCIKTIYIGTSTDEYTVAQWLLTAPLRCKISTIDSLEQAAEFSGKEVRVEKRFASKLQKEEYYYADLYNVQVVVDEQVLGTIVGISDCGYAPLFEIEWNSNKKSYVPFVQQFFALPNLSKGTISLIMPELAE